MTAESAATEQECLTLAFDGPVATLTLRHGSMNAIGDALLDELAETFEVVAAHSEVSVLRIRSERRVFSAGADLRLVAGRLESASGADRAIADYDEAIRLDPNFTKAIELRSKALMNKKEWESGSLYNRGVRHIDEGQEDLAIADWSEAISANPNLDLAFIQRGLAYANICEFDKAIADYSEAIRLNPQRAGYFWIRGDAYVRKIELDRAIADYDEAIRLDPNLIQATEAHARITAWIKNGRAVPKANPGEAGT